MMTKPQRRPLGSNLAIGQRLDLGQSAPAVPASLPDRGKGGDKSRERPSTAADPRPASIAATEKVVSNSISLPDELWEELRLAAHARRRRQGGRTSVSALIRELLDQHRDEWSINP